MVVSRVADSVQAVFDAFHRIAYSHLRTPEELLDKACSLKALNERTCKRVWVHSVVCVKVGTCFELNLCSLVKRWSVMAVFR